MYQVIGYNTILKEWIVADYDSYAKAMERQANLTKYGWVSIIIHNEINWTRVK